MEMKDWFKLLEMILKHFNFPETILERYFNTAKRNKSDYETEQERFICSMHDSIIQLANNEKASTSTIEKLKIFFTKSNLNGFSIKSLLNSFDDINKYCNDVTYKFFDNCLKNDPEAQEFSNILLRIITAIHDNISIFASTEEMTEEILSRFCSYENLLNQNSQLLKDLKYDNSFAQLIDKSELPKPIHKNSFNFRNPYIKFYGREKEMAAIEAFLECKGVSLWAVTGSAGSGKSKLALHIAHKYELKNEWKTVWLDTSILNRILDFSDFRYSKKILFICDYASIMEKDINTIVERMDNGNSNTKFLLLERPFSWYTEFLNRNEYSKEKAYDDKPINLEMADFEVSDLYNMIDDFTRSTGLKKEISINEKDMIIMKARELSKKRKNESIRCLLLLLLTDAFVKNGNIDGVDFQSLFKNHIAKSKMLMKNQYVDKPDLVDIGYRILAFATAFGGLDWQRTEIIPVSSDINDLIDTFKRKVSDIESFIRLISDSEDNDSIIEPLTPDILGECLFLSEWADLINSDKNAWINELLKREYSRSMLARCISDWRKEGSEFKNDVARMPLIDSIEKKEQWVSVLSKAVLESSSISNCWDYIADIETLGIYNSVEILYQYVSALTSIAHKVNDFRIKKCNNRIMNVELDRFDPKEDEIQKYLDCIMGIGFLLYETGDYCSSLYYYNKTLTILDNYGEIGRDYLATVYNNMGLIYIKIYNYDKAEHYYNKSIAIKAPEKVSESYCLYCNNIAGVYRDQEQYSKAKKKYLEALHIRTQISGKNHPMIPILYNNLGYIYCKENKLEKAKEYYEKALKLQIKLPDADKSIEAQIYNNKAGVFECEHNYRKAIEMYKYALEIEKKTHHDTHISLAITYDNIARIYNYLGLFFNAKDYYEKAIEIYEKVLGGNHQRTLDKYIELGRLCIAYGYNRIGIEYLLRGTTTTHLVKHYLIIAKECKQPPQRLYQ